MSYVSSLWFLVTPFDQRLPLVVSFGDVLSDHILPPPLLSSVGRQLTPKTTTTTSMKMYPAEAGLGGSTEMQSCHKLVRTRTLVRLQWPTLICIALSLCCGPPAPPKKKEEKRP